MGFADLHMHTIFSYDGTAAVPAVLRRARQIGLNVIAITDHDEVRGALQALDLASHYGVDVIPGIEVTTADGDLLVLNVTHKIPRGLSLAETLARAKEAGGTCIAPHPMVRGMGMKSLSWNTIWRTYRTCQAASALVGIETYNATVLDPFGNEFSYILANQLGLARTGSSDAHVLDTIGLGATEFPGTTAADLLTALTNRSTHVAPHGEAWSPLHILGSWVVNYIGSTFTRLSMSTQ